MELPAAQIEHVLEHWPVARLATSGPDGPHQVPVVFARTGDRLWIPVDGKPKSGRELARIRNARRDPRVGLLLDAYRDDWNRLWWLRVDGRARVVQPADPSADREVAAAVEALRRKYPQYEKLPVLAEPPTLLEVAPHRTTSWCAGPEALDRN